MSSHKEHSLTSRPNDSAHTDTALASSDLKAPAVVVVAFVESSASDYIEAPCKGAWLTMPAWETSMYGLPCLIYISLSVD